MEGSVMNRIRHIGRLVRVLIGLAVLGAAFAITPAALASVPPPDRFSRTVPVAPSPHQAHAAAAVGMAGWQIALIAVGAAILAATVAVLLDRARARRHELAATPA
jgi:hypothetical protein